MQMREILMRMKAESCWSRKRIEDFVKEIRDCHHETENLVVRLSEENGRLRKRLEANGQTVRNIDRFEDVDEAWKAFEESNYWFSLQESNPEETKSESFKASAFEGWLFERAAK